MEPIYQSQEETIDIKKFLIKFLQNWYWFVLSVIVALFLAYLINRYNDPIYNINSTLIIDDEKKSTNDLLINVLDRFSIRKNVENEIAVLKSYKLAYRSISELPDFHISYFTVGRVRTPMLYKTTPFKVIPDTSSNSFDEKVFVNILSKSEYMLWFEGEKSKKKQKFGVPYIDQKHNFTIFYQDQENKSISNTFYFIINDLNALAKEYQQKLNISTNDKKGTVLTLSTTGFVPQMEADYLNTLMNAYIKSGLEEKNQAAINTINFIDEQLSSVVDSLHKAEDKLQNFRLTNKIIDISSEGNAIMTRLEKIQEDKMTLDMQLRYYKHVQEYIEKKKDFRQLIAPSVMGISDPLLNSLVAELADLFSQRNILSTNAQQNFPGLSQINAKIQNTMDALRENVNQIIASASGSLKEFENRQDEVEKEIQRLPVTERHLLTIQRDFKLNDQIYNFLLQRRADAAISRASNVADNKILDLAQARDAIQISPKSGRNKMIAIILGLLLPLSIIVIIEYFNDKIVEPKDIEKMTNIAIYGSIGHNDQLSDIPVAENPKSAIAESFRSLRTNLQYVLRNGNEKIICISSTVSGEGKTFTAVNLASIIAQSNKKTLLISLDLRKPKIHKIFDLENDKGISSFLIGRTSFEDTIHSTPINNLFVSSAGPIPPNPAELLETAMMDNYIAKAKLGFDIIVIDTPPLAAVTDAFILMRFSDSFLFIVRQNYSSKTVLQLADEIQKKRDVKNLGIVINDVKINTYYGRKYGYGYGYNYSYGVDYYEENADKKLGIGSRITRLISKN